jgi:hypothetical protein
VKYARQPGSDVFLSRVAASPDTPLRHGRQAVKEFETFLTDGNDAQRIANLMLSLAVPLSLVQIEVKGALVDRRVGDKVRLTRSRGPSNVGSLSGVLYRITALRGKWQRGSVQADLVLDIPTTT